MAKATPQTDITRLQERICQLERANGDLQDRLRAAEARAGDHDLLAELYETAPVGLALLDRDLRFVRVNRLLADMHGISVADHIGRKITELLPHVSAKVADLMREILRTGRARLGREVASQTPAQPGVTREWVADYYPVWQQGEIVGLGACVREVTEQRRLERALRDSEARLKQIFDTAPALIALCEGPDHVITYSNPLHDRLVAGGDAVGRPLREVLPDLATPAMIGKFDSVLRTGAPADTEELPIAIGNGTALSVRWFRQRLLPHVGADGRIAGVINFLFDITDQVTARHQADRARWRLQTLQDSLAAFVGLLTPDGTLTHANETALAAAGLRPEDVIGRKFWDAYWWNWDRDTQDRLRAAVARAAEGETVRYDAEVQVRDGAHIIIDFQLVPVIEDDGTVSGIIPSAIDITDRRQAEERLRETLAQHQAFFENAPVGLAMLDLDRRWIRVNPAFASLFGIPVADHIGKRPEELIPGIVLHPDPVGEIRRTGKPIVDYQTRTPTAAYPDETRTLLHNFFPILVDGELRAVGKSVRDVTEQTAARERQALLIAELQHRVKNILATVQSVARYTARHSNDKEAMVQSLQTRLAAIARTHDALTRENWSGQWLKTLIRAELSAYESDDRRRVTISGDDVLLSPSQAMSFGLALHELATNAAKYGALSAESGHLEIAIAAAPGGALRHMVWQECGGPPVVAPSRQGFGSFLLEKVLAAELGARIDSEFGESGLRVTIDAGSG